MDRIWISLGSILTVFVAAGALFLFGWTRTVSVAPAPAAAAPVQGALIDSTPGLSTGGSAASQPVSPTISTAIPPTSVAPVSASAPVAPATAGGEASGIPAVSFDQLASYEYVMPAEPMVEAPALIPGGSEQIPAKIRNLENQVISVQGFMLPLKIQNGLVHEMLIMRTQSMCCFGVVPKINEWVNVKMTSQGVKPIMDQPVVLFGRFHVGEMRENGYLTGLYRMEGDRMALTEGM